MKNAFTKLVGIDSPLVCFNRTSAVVAAVTNSGGLGVLAASAYTPPQLDQAMTWIEHHVGGRPYGVDVLVPAKSAVGDPDNLINGLRAQIPQAHIDFVDDILERYGIAELPDTVSDPVNDEILSSLTVGSRGIADLLDVAFSHRIALVANALGTPPPALVERAHASGVAVAALVGQAKHAVRQIDAGVDLLIAQGTEAGGHTGTIATMVLTPEIVDLAGALPVLAAGGIASGRQMAAALALGASGVWTGSVWLSSVEDMTPDVVKTKYLAAHSNDTVRSTTRTGKPARQLRSAWHEEWEKPDSPVPLAMPLQPMLVADAWTRIDVAAQGGNEEAKRLESFFIGQVVGSFTSLRPATDIARSLIDDCEATLRALAAGLSQ